MESDSYNFIDPPGKSFHAFAVEWREIPRLPGYAVSWRGELINMETFHLYRLSESTRHQANVKKPDGSWTTVRPLNEAVRLFLGPKPVGSFKAGLDEHGVVAWLPKAKYQVGPDASNGMPWNPTRQWKSINGFPKYQISSDGWVKSLVTGKILTEDVNRSVALRHEGNRTYRRSVRVLMKKHWGDANMQAVERDQ